MSQGDLMQWGVSVFIANHNFIEFDRYAYFKNAVTSGAEFHTVDVDGAALDLRADNTGNNGAVCVPGVTLKLGPSTHANNLGATETITISSLDIDGADYKVTATANLLYDYSADDQIQILTAPLGWTPYYNTYFNTRKYKRSDPRKYGNSNIDWSAGYAAKLTRSTSAAASLARLLQYTKMDTVLAANGVHKLIVVGYASGTTGQCTVQLDTYQSNSTLVTHNALSTTFSGNTSWVEKTATFTPGANSSRANIRLFIDSGIVQSTSLYLDQVILVHGGGIPDAANGIYTSTEYFDEGSFKFDKISKHDVFDFMNNTDGAYDHAGGRVRYWFTATYTDVSQAFYDNITMLEKQCKNGKLLAVWPFIDDLPQIMVGRLQILSPEKTIYDLSSRNITIRFVQSY